MEFWGVEVKPNQTLKCEPGDDKLLHLSLATLADSKKSAENVVLYVTFNNQKLVIGTLSGEKCPHINHDLIFEKEFELSHNSKNATVHFTGYKSIQNDDVPSDFDDLSSEEEEEIKVASKANGSLKVKLDDVNKDTAQKAKAGKPIKAEKKDSDDDDEDSDDDDEDSDDDEDMEDAGNSDDEEDESDDEEEEDDDDSSEEETPEPAKGKKRPAEVAKKATESEKKTKLATPADGKKGGEAKKGTTTPAKSEKSDKGKQQTPKSAGSVSCKSCSKTFNSEGALESHTKAKHSAK